MIQMGMGEKDHVNRGSIEAERHGIVVMQFAAALKQAAIDQDAVVFRFHQMAGAGHILGRAMKRDFHVPSVAIRGSPFLRYQSRMLCQAVSAVSAYQKSSRSSASITPS